MEKYSRYYRTVKAIGPNEAKMIRLYAKGLTHHAVADLMGCARTTLSAKLLHVKRYAGVTNVAQLVSWAYDNQILIPKINGKFQERKEAVETGTLYRTWRPQKS